jgi:hypothetical protein
MCIELPNRVLIQRMVELGMACCGWDGGSSCLHDVQKALIDCASLWSD